MQHLRGGTERHFGALLRLQLVTCHFLLPLCGVSALISAAV